MLTAVLCFVSVPFIGYRTVALILLLVVSIHAILFDIFPVMLTALQSALIWNFFFIPPLYTLHISTPEDALMFLMYFVIASINVVLTYQIREVELKERAEREKLKVIELYNTLINSLSHELRTPISAFGTVGLSTGITGNLSSFGKMVVIFVMFVGRLGVLTFGLAILARRKEMKTKAYEGDWAV